MQRHGPVAVELVPLLVDLLGARGNDVAGQIPDNLEDPPIVVDRVGRVERSVIDAALGVGEVIFLRARSI
jgi:hypothetical protein